MAWLDFKNAPYNITQQCFLRDRKIKNSISFRRASSFSLLISALSLGISLFFFFIIINNKSKIKSNVLLPHIYNIFICITKTCCFLYYLTMYISLNYETTCSPKPLKRVLYLQTFQSRGYFFN